MLMYGQSSQRLDHKVGVPIRGERRDPSNTSPLVRGAEMRVAETRAVNRALRKAYGIGHDASENLITLCLNVTEIDIRSNNESFIPQR